MTRLTDVLTITPGPVPSDRSGVATWMGSLDPLVMLLVVVAAGLYADGVLRLWRRGERKPVGTWHTLAFGTGLVLLVAATSYPLEPLSEQLLSAHMVQHLVLILGCAPLIAAGRPQLVLPAVLPARVRRGRRGARRVARALWGSRPPSVDLIAAAHIAVLWFWHVPGAYEAAISNGLVHRLEHASLTGTALALWLAVLMPNRRARLRHGLAVLSVAAVLIAGGVLGALLTFASVPLYPSYAGGLGLSPVEDQQLAGVLLWVPSGGFYGITGALLFRRWFALLEQPTGSAPRMSEPV